MLSYSISFKKVLTSIQSRQVLFLVDNLFEKYDSGALVISDVPK